MKLKYYLRGLGTGILFATIILFVSYSYKMSDKQIKEKALELGMVYPDEEETTSKDVTTGESSTEATTLEVQSTEENTTSAVNTEESSSEEKTTEEKTTQETTTKKEEKTEETTTKSDKPQKTYELTVTSRTTSMDVAKKLKNAGIIDDADKFNDYLCDNGYASKIQNGTFTINSNMSYKEIAEFIIRKSNAN